MFSEDTDHSSTVTVSDKQQCADKRTRVDNDGFGDTVSSVDVVLQTRTINVQKSQRFGGQSMGFFFLRSFHVR